MKKSTYIVIVLSVFGGLMFALGMCMALLPEWNLFHQGILLGSIGASVLLAAVLVYRKASGCAPVKIRLKTVLISLYGLVSVLVFGAGMAMVLVESELLIQGILTGTVGILLLLGLIPMMKGIKE